MNKLNETSEEIKSLTKLIEEVKAYPYKVKKITIEWVDVHIQSHVTTPKPKITIEYE